MEFDHKPDGAMAIHAKVPNQLVFKADGTLESATKPDLKTASPETLATVGAVREMNRMPLFFQGIHNGTREGLQRVYKGCATPNDAIQISALTHPELVKAVLRGDVATCDEAAFQADPYQRGKWSRGTAYLDGAGKPQGWVRTPDLNQAMPDSLPPPFARGGANAKVGAWGRDTMRKVEGRITNLSHGGTGYLHEGINVSGAFKVTSPGEGSKSTIQNSTGSYPSAYLDFDSSAGVAVGHTGTEFAPWHVYGVSYSITSNGVFNEGAIDAEQAMSELLAIKGTVGISGQAKNLQCAAKGTNSLVNVTADQLFVESVGSQTRKLRAVKLSIDTATVGANGLDSGVLAASTWYSLWVIAGDGGVAGLASLSATAPVLPAGYTQKCRVGWVRTDASANKYPLGFTQNGAVVRYLVDASSNVPVSRSMASGVVGSPVTPTWGAVGISNFVPPTASEISVVVYCNVALGAAVAAPNNSYGNINSTTNPPPVIAAPSRESGLSASISNFLIESQNIYFASNGAAANLLCVGWVDSI